MLDPSRITSPSLSKSIDYLDRLNACRAFTAHQMSEIFRRMERPRDERDTLEEESLLIVTSAHSMFLDTQLGTVEATCSSATPSEGLGEYRGSDASLYSSR